MYETKVKAIVLGNKDYKEKDMLVTLFTLEHGVVTVVFRGVKNANAKLKSAKEIFSFGDFIYSSGNFKTVTSAEIINSFYSITKNIRNYFSACNIIKIIKSALPEGETSPALFVDTLKALNLLNDGGIDPIQVVNKFLIRVFEGFGYSFNLGKCSTCGANFISKRYINLKYGDITCASCRVGEVEELSPAMYSALRLFSLTDYNNLQSLKISPSVNQQVFDLLNKNFYHRFNYNLDVI